MGRGTADMVDADSTAVTGPAVAPHDTQMVPLLSISTTAISGTSTAPPVSRTLAPSSSSPVPPSSWVLSSSTYLLHSRLGAGRARSMACDPQHASMKLLPWAGVAARLAVRESTGVCARAHSGALELQSAVDGAACISTYLRLAAVSEQASVASDISSGSALHLSSSTVTAGRVPLTSLSATSSIPTSILSHSPEKGRAYVFLPLPISTGLVIHANGLFERELGVEICVHSCILKG